VLGYLLVKEKKKSDLVNVEREHIQKGISFLKEPHCHTDSVADHVEQATFQSILDILPLVV
jgi:hypothetical protein